MSRLVEQTHGFDKRGREAVLWSLERATWALEDARHTWMDNVGDIVGDGKWKLEVHDWVRELERQRAMFLEEIGWQG